MRTMNDETGRVWKEEVVGQFLDISLQEVRSSIKICLSDYHKLTSAYFDTATNSVVQISGRSVFTNCITTPFRPERRTYFDCRPASDMERTCKGI